MQPKLQLAGAKRPQEALLTGFKHRLSKIAECIFREAVGEVWK
jgi:hypothetical protein